MRKFRSDKLRGRLSKLVVLCFLICNAAVSSAADDGYFQSYEFKGIPKVVLKNIDVRVYIKPAKEDEFTVKTTGGKLADLVKISYDSDGLKISGKETNGQNRIIVSSTGTTVISGNFGSNGTVIINGRVINNSQELQNDPAEASVTVAVPGRGRLVIDNSCNLSVTADIDSVSLICNSAGRAAFERIKTLSGALSGAVRVTATEVRQITLKLSGASSFKAMNVEGGELKAVLSDSSTIDASGSFDSVEIESADASRALISGEVKRALALKAQSAASIVFKGKVRGVVNKSAIGAATVEIISD
ncbi:MAG: hypothetical protein D6719_05950 [Candidatus Dadabacteria bacterium]|nr:MAG: hypothetical protein D6719_05950 [Candidatus Dadabacteria bacterium]